MKRNHPAKNHAHTLSRRGITGYLAGAAGFTAVLAAPQADAAVTAITFGFGPVFDISDGNGAFSTGGFGSLLGYANSYRLNLGFANGTPGAGNAYQTGSYFPGTGHIKFFAGGTTIGGGGNGILGASYFRQDGIPTLDFTTDQLNKNIGYQTTAGNWGWANVSWDEAAKAMTVNSAFVESVPNTPITIVPEPTVASLLVLGAVAAARGRRRQKTAA